jgi:hypothetical protein
MGRLVYEGEDLSTERENCLQRGRLIYGGGDSFTKGETHLRRGKFVYGGGESSTVGRLVYGGGDLSTEGKTRLQRGRLMYRIFLLMMEQNCGKLSFRPTLLLKADCSSVHGLYHWVQNRYKLSVHVILRYKNVNNPLVCKNAKSCPLM